MSKDSEAVLWIPEYSAYYQDNFKKSKLYLIQTLLIISISFTIFLLAIVFVFIILYGEDKPIRVALNEVSINQPLFSINETDNALRSFWIFIIPIMTVTLTLTFVFSVISFIFNFKKLKKEPTGFFYYALFALMIAVSTSVLIIIPSITSYNKDTIANEVIKLIPIEDSEYDKTTGEITGLVNSEKTSFKVEENGVKPIEFTIDFPKEVIEVIPEFKIN